MTHCQINNSSRLALCLFAVVLLSLEEPSVTLKIKKSGDYSLIRSYHSCLLFTRQTTVVSDKLIR